MFFLEKVIPQRAGHWGKSFEVGRSFQRSPWEQTALSRVVPLSNYLPFFVRRAGKVFFSLAVSSGPVKSAILFQFLRPSAQA